MILLISFLIGIQILDGLATSPPLHFVYPSCNSSEIKAAAEAAINELNAHRREGYVLGLQRIFDAHEIPEWDGNTLFYLNLDVLETDCYVLNGEPCKECRIRNLHETVYGQCKVTIEFNRNSNDWHLHSYLCILQPVPASDIKTICPDCPTPGDPSEARFQKTAVETLAKFNAESNQNNYFAILNVTKASSQWVFGPSNTVEYTIQETSCRKSSPVSDITQCPLLPTESAERGLCKGSVTDSHIERKKMVTVKCNLFLRPLPVADEQTPQSTFEPQEPNHPDTSTNSTETSSKQKETVGQVIYHYPWSKHAVPEVQEANPTSSPALASPEQEATPHLAKPARPAIPPFPRGFSQSAECPGDITIHVHVLQLPSRPQAATSQTKGDVQN